MLCFSGTRRSIVEILSRDWPLSAKQIHNRLLRDTNKNISYQAVHKTILSLVDEKVLEKRESKYVISSNWIKSIKLSAEFLEAKYLCEFERKEMFEILSSNCVKYRFNSILELADFLVGIFFNLPNPNKKPSINLWTFTYSIVGLKDDSYFGLRNSFEKNDTYVFVSENNLVDKIFAKTLKEYGVKEIKFNKKGATPLQDIMVFSDYIAHIWYSPKFRAAWFKQQRKPKNLEDFDLSSHLRRMRDEKCLITVVVVKDSYLSNQIRDAYLGKVPGLPI